MRKYWSKCKKCGYKEDGICAIFFGHKCDNCGGVDCTTVHSRKVKQ